MSKRIFSAIMIFLMVLGTIALAFKMQPVKAQSTTIIVPDDYPTIQAAINAASDGDTVFVRNGTYIEQLTLNKILTVQGEDRDTTILDGSIIVDAINVSISGFTIKGQDAGPSIYDEGYDNCTVAGNIVTSKGVSNGIYFVSSSSNLVSQNIVESNLGTGIGFDWSYGNIVRNNTIMNNNRGIGVGSISGNDTFSENDIIGNYYGICIGFSGSRCFNSSFFHNNMIDNTNQVAFFGPIDTNFWDSGYPSGGNYWSDYTGTDIYWSAYQNQTGSDGIGDTPYVINANNTDNYPLMNPWSPHDIAVTNVEASKTVVGCGCDVELNVTVMNLGDYAENFHLAFVSWDRAHGYEYVYNTTECFSLPGSTNYFTSEWNTSNFAYGTYTAKAMAEVVLGETNTANNNCIGDNVTVTIPGDINGDFRVNMGDISALCDGFGATIGPDGSYWHHPAGILDPFSPSLDIDGNGVVNMGDIVTALDNFGQHFP